MNIDPTTSIESRQIYDAILRSYPESLEMALESINPALVAPDHRYAGRLGGAGHDNNDDTFISFLHIAVAKCVIGEGSSLSVLMKYHLKYSSQAAWSKTYYIPDNVNFSSYFLRECQGFQISGQSPLQLAVTLVNKVATERKNYLTSCINELLDFEKKLVIKIKEELNLAKIPVKPGSVSKTWESLLLSEKYADVVIEVTDDSTAPPTISTLKAHRSVLASSSEYFDAMLSGEWQETMVDGSVATIKVHQTLDAYKCLLKFIYTGEIDTMTVRNHCTELIDLAAQGQYDELITVCEEEGIKTVNLDNVLNMLLSSYHHDLKCLKAASIDYIKNNIEHFLTSSRVASLINLEKIDLNEKE